MYWGWIPCHSYHASSCHIVHIACSSTYHIISCTYRFIKHVTTYTVLSNVLHHNIYHFISTSHYNTCHNINISYHRHIISQTYQSYHFINISHISSIFHVQNHGALIIIQTSTYNYTHNKTTYLVGLSQSYYDPLMLA